MKLTAKIKLYPTPEQHGLLLKTLEAANAACNDISQQAWNSETFGQFSLHKVVYHDIRHRYPLAAQMVVRAVGKVADAYKRDRKTRRTFVLHGAFPYDDHILSFKTDEQTVSIWTLEGRQRIGYRCGERQCELLEGERGEADLCYLNGKFYLFVACEVETPEPEDVNGFLGVDTGVANIATDSDGNNYSSAHLNGLRHRHARLRAKLQQKGTKSSRRLLKRRHRKEARFARDVNHCISKQLVQRAKDTGRGIAVEDLTGIRNRVTVRKAHRRQLHSWAFHDLRQKIEYKARLAGVPVVAVDPRNTSRTCPVCGCVDKRNRPQQAVFSCVTCGFSGHADHIAAVNIGRRAVVVNQPNVSDMGDSPLPSGGFPVAPGTSYRLSADSC
jgi:putative transposase